MMIKDGNGSVQYLPGPFLPLPTLLVSRKCQRQSFRAPWWLWQVQYFSFNECQTRHPADTLIRKAWDDFELTVAPAALGRAQKSDILGQDAGDWRRMKFISQLPVPLHDDLLISQLVIYEYVGPHILSMTTKPSLTRSSSTSFTLCTTISKWEAI